jgi:predicted nucleic acid-binding protein
VVLDSVIQELDDGRDRGHPDAEKTEALVKKGLLEIVSLNGAALDHFESLVIGPATATLDDGEAATLAHAHNCAAIPLIDERKARRICRARFPDLRIGCTLDVIRASPVQIALGKDGLAEAVHNALRNARMRVPEEYLDWVLDIVGKDRVALCSSLPRLARSKSRFPRAPL